MSYGIRDLTVYQKGSVPDQDVPRCTGHGVRRNHRGATYGRSCAQQRRIQETGLRGRGQSRGGACRFQPT